MRSKRDRRHPQGDCNEQSTSADSDGIQTLVIGLDGACLPILESLFEDVGLPHIQSIFDSGVTGALESQIPPWTPSAWPSLYTGVNPGKHGVFSFLDYKGYDWSVVNGTNVHADTLWEHLSRQGITSVVVNVPVTHPPREFNGALIPGYMAPESPRCHPSGLLTDLQDTIGEYRIYPDTTAANATEAVTEYGDVIQMRGDAFCYLVDRFDPDFGFVQFQQTDTIFHEFPGDWEIVRAVYEAVDEQIGRILDKTNPDTVLVVSDHGIGEMNSSGFYVNEFLAEHGYTVVSQGGSGMPSWVPVRESQLRKGDDSTESENSSEDTDLLRRLTAVAARFGLTTHRAGTLLAAVGLRDFVAAHVPGSIVRASNRQVDFPASQAYMRARIECGVRINLEGRDPEGVVPPERYEDVRSDIIDLLREVETPDGKPVFEKVARREKYFDGPDAEEAVDIVTVPTDFDHFLSAELAGQMFADPGQPWNHKRNGVVALAGTGVDGSLSDAHIFDVTPTILSLFDIPKSVEMDGNVFSCVESVGERAYSTRRQDTGDEPTDMVNEPNESNDESIVNRLTALGYLE
ncbi:alkaline phosphatase family protein [Halomicrococcus sp. NG-SE-24]|uniref:alkaline phosphatase family protein n=1 Tax=Halomicrococcus sp. NG-SE-24 TaxID=3436928 RepID=UPI003D986AE7